MRLIAKYIYLIFAALLLTFCTKGEESNSGESVLILTPSSSFSVVSSSSEVTFSATLDGKDVSKSDDLMVFNKTKSGSKMVDGNSFTVSYAGTYTFYAIYGNHMSAEIEVRGITNLPDAAEDSAPEQFDSFAKRAMAVFATGTWCSACPLMINIVHDYLEINDNLVVCEAHDGDIMSCPAAEYFLDNLSTTSFPTLYIGANSGNKLSGGSNITALTARVKTELETPAATAISASTTYENNVVCVRADVKVATRGQYRIGAVLIEDGIYSEQNAAPAEWMHIHDNVICGLAPASLTVSEMLSGTTVQEAGSSHMFYCEFDFTKLYTVVSRENCRLVIYTYNNAERKVDNVIEVGMGKSLSYQYEE